MPISSTLWSMWGVVLQKRGAFFININWEWGKRRRREREQERESENLVLQKRGVLFFLHRREVSFFFFIEVSDGNREKKMREEREKDIVKVQCCRREVSFFIRIELGRRRREMEEREKVK